MSDTDATDPSAAPAPPPVLIYVDADGCPVKQEVYKVARRYGARVILAAHIWMRIPDEEWLTLEVVEQGFDAADDWIVEQVVAHDIVVTGDIELAGRCLEKEAYVIGHRGNVFTEDDIGQALGMRELFAHLRGMGETTGGPAPFQPRDRSNFLQRLDEAINRVRRRRRAAP